MATPLATRVPARRKNRKARIARPSAAVPMRPGCDGNSSAPARAGHEIFSLLASIGNADGLTQEGGQRAHDGVHVARDHDRLFICLRRLEILQLAIEETRRKEVLQPRRKAPAKLFTVDAEIH